MGGIGWQAVHYVLGLSRLGHDVYYVEDSGAHPYDPRVKSVVGDAGYSVAFLADVMGRFGLADRWAYVDALNGAHYGLSRERLAELYRDADALFNVCGATRLPEEHLRCPIRAYVETDPVFEQIRVAEGDRRAILAREGHTHHFTYGENMGQPDSPIPLEVRVAADPASGDPRPLEHPLRPDGGAIHHDRHLEERGQGHPLPGRDVSLVQAPQLPPGDRPAEPHPAAARDGGGSGGPGDARPPVPR